MKKWSAEFEKILSIYTAKLYRVKKCNGAKVYWRQHDLNVSYTLFEDREFTQLQRKETGYSFDQTIKDMNDVQIDLESIRKMYS